VQFKAADGIVVHGDSERPAGRPRGTILLFHQAGSNLAEYAPIAPVLVRAGFATLAIDQRSGGRMWGRANATAAGVKGGADYAAALPDLAAALAQAKGAGPGPIIVWGSSYSAALVFLLAAAHPEIAAVLAFSPGEYIDGQSISGAAARLKIPVFVTSAADRGEIAAARQIAASVPGGRGTQFVPRAGVHGSSTLRQDSDPAGAAANWAAVMAFLDRVAPPAK
jgi:alpha-beta hydrolase superfamily lysophospholipase